jgi:glyoxylase-like metal-dependent hydrolase (beta-lactamase superfamily II)
VTKDIVTVRRVLLCAATAVLCGATFTAAQTNTDAGLPWEAAKVAILKKFDGVPHSAQQIEPFKVVDNIFFVGLETVASYLIPTSDGLILVDATYADTADVVLENVRKVGQDPTKIRYILISHGHADHAGGAARIKALTGARVGMSVAEWDSVERLQGGPQASQSSGTRLTRDLVIKDGDMLTLGDTQLWFYVIGGHTPGNMATEIHAVAAGRQFRAVLGVTFEPAQGPAAASVKSVERLKELGPWDAMLPSHPYLAPAAIPVTARQAFGLEPLPPNPTKQAALVGAQRVNAYLDQIRAAIQARSSR